MEKAATQQTDIVAPYIVDIAYILANSFLFSLPADINIHLELFLWRMYVQYS